jgi:hypothetical protein
MREKKELIEDILEMRTLMERSTRFHALAGSAGILVGVYALAGAALAFWGLGFHPQEGSSAPLAPGVLPRLVALALTIVVLAGGTAALLSWRKAARQGERLWNATTRRLLTHAALPFLSGAVVISILAVKGLPGLAAPLSLLFYGLALFSGGYFTYEEVKLLGLVEIVLGVLSLLFIEQSLLFWAAGFGLAHIVYGIYLYNRYER